MTGDPVPCITYVSSTVRGDLAAGQELLAEYAQQHNLTVISAFADDDGPRPPEEKPQLQVALAAIREGLADVLLTVSSTMISPVGSEYSAVLGEVSQANGQLISVGWSRSKRVVEPPTAVKPATTTKPSLKPSRSPTKPDPLLKGRAAYLIGAVLHVSTLVVWAVMANDPQSSAPSATSAALTPPPATSGPPLVIRPVQSTPTPRPSGASSTARPKPTSEPKASPVARPRPSVKNSSKSQASTPAKPPQISIRGRANRMPYLEVAAGDSNDGARVTTTDTWTDGAQGRNQWWVIHRFADGTVALESALAPGKVLSLNQSNQGMVWTANPGTSLQGTASLEKGELPAYQRWKLLPTGDGWSQLMSANGGQWCLYDRVTRNEPVMIAACQAGNVWQQWVVGKGPSTPTP